VYRDDLDAARARVESLESELRRGRAEIARLERTNNARCTSREHAEQVKRIEVLTKHVETLRRRARNEHPITLHGDLESQVAALREQAADLELLAAGDEVMAKQLEACERDIAQLELLPRPDPAPASVALTVQGNDAGRIAWVPRRGLMRRLARAVLGDGLWPIGMLMTVVGFGVHPMAVWLAAAGVPVALAGLILRHRRGLEDDLERAQASDPPSLLEAGEP
jgi:hypothetical protein